MQTFTSESNIVVLAWKHQSSTSAVLAELAELYFYYKLLTKLLRKAISLRFSCISPHCCRPPSSTHHCEPITRLHCQQRCLCAICACVIIKQSVSFNDTNRFNIEKWSWIYYNQLSVDDQFGWWCWLVVHSTDVGHDSLEHHYLLSLWHLQGCFLHHWDMCGRDCAPVTACK